MKQIFSIVFAGIIGGLVVFGGIKITENNATEINQGPIPSALLTNANSASVYPVDFVIAAEKAMPVVVHIRAAESEVLAQQRRQSEDDTNQRFKSPFDDFFNFDDFFGGQGFGRGQYQQRGSGSGVIFSKEGYIVTNNHVVGFADEIEVTLFDNRKFIAKKIGTDPSSDLAVIKIEAQNLPVLNLANSDEVKVGEWVLAVGNPYDYLTSTVTAGIISAKGRDIDIIKDQKAIEQFIQTDAAINPGNSGGALVTTDGELLGINTAIATPTGSFAGYSFAIPSNLVTKIVNDIIENGDIERANLGVYGLDVDDELAVEENLKVKKGFYVSKVNDGSAAQFSGVLPGDVIIGVNNKKIDGFQDLKEALKFTKVGDTLKVKVNRFGSSKVLSIRLRKGL
jgi:S1-C subfamily serine protease